MNQPIKMSQIPNHRITKIMALPSRQHRSMLPTNLKRDKTWKSSSKRALYIRISRQRKTESWPRQQNANKLKMKFKILRINMPFSRRNMTPSNNWCKLKMLQQQLKLQRLFIKQAMLSNHFSIPCQLHLINNMKFQHKWESHLFQKIKLMNMILEIFTILTNMRILLEITTKMIKPKRMKSKLIKRAIQLFRRTRPNSNN